jgi:hypothetical protein
MAVQSLSSTISYILLENSNIWRALGAWPAPPGCEQPIQIPYVSTDRARIVTAYSSGQEGSSPEYYYSPPITIRPDARVSDAPPTITLQAPQPGAAFPGGSAVPLRWTASDDESIHAFHIQASYDGGRTWSFIATNLSPATTAFNWRLPSSNGIPDVAVKVIAIDHRFQDTSAIAPIVILPGASQPCPADFNADGLLNPDDISEFITCFFLSIQFPGFCPPADFNLDTLLNPDDLSEFITAFFLAC